METAVAKSMAALINIKRSAGWHCTWIPYGISIFDIVVFSVGIYRDIIVAVTSDTEQLCIFIEAIAAAGVGNQCEEILGAKVIDPWQRGIWCCNNIFFIGVIKMSEIHSGSPLINFILAEFFLIG